MQKHLLSDFTAIYHADLHGNVRRNPKLSGTTHNVFGIKVGVGITLAVRRKGGGKHRLHYHRVPETWRKEEKLLWFAEQENATNVAWQVLPPGEWLKKGDEFYSTFVALGEKGSKEVIFDLHSLGVVTSRDEWVYAFSKVDLEKKLRLFIKNYNYEVFRLNEESTVPKDIDAFVNSDPAFLKWTDRLKKALADCQTLKFDPFKLRQALYRPFTRTFLYFDHLLNQRRYQQHHIFPTGTAGKENEAITLTSYGSEKPFMTLIGDRLPDLHLVGAGEIARNSVESQRPSTLLDYAAAAWLASGFRETVLAKEASSSGISRNPRTLRNSNRISARLKSLCDN